MQRLKARIVAAMHWLAEAWRQKWCLLIDHDAVLEYGPGEVYQRCTRCGCRSDGWQQRTDTQPILKFEGDPARHVLDDTVEAVFGIPAGDPSPMFEDAGFEAVPPMVQRPGFVYAARETCFGVHPSKAGPMRILSEGDILSEAEARLLMMRTSRTKH